MLNNMTKSAVLPPLPVTIAASLEGMATTVLAIEEWLVKQQLIPILFNHATNTSPATAVPQDIGGTTGGRIGSNIMENWYQTAARSTSPT
jgi:hypothetical protein